jgi:hypothetical protein
VSRLFKRQAKVTLARSIVGAYFQLLPNAIEITDLRVIFTIEKNLEKDPNTAKIAIYNLSFQTRAEFQRKPVYVTVDAGYDGNMKRVFAGDLRYSASVHEGADWVTSIEAGDGERALENARADKSYNPGVNAKTILQDLADSMGIALPKNVADSRELVKQYSTGFTITGPSAEVMDRIIAPFEKAWSVQDGRLQILGDDETSGDRAFVLSQAEGLVGSPTLNPPSKPGEKPKLIAKSLLYQELYPGCKIALKSQQLNGEFKTVRVAHICDTHGPDWYTEIEGVPL